MNCGTVKKLIYEYCDGRLFGLERKLFEEHVSSCPDCSRELDEEKAFFATLDKLEPEQPPVWFEENIIRQLKLGGLIYEPRVPIHRKAAAAFKRLPEAIRYPATALAVIMAIYIPTRIIMVLLKGFLAKAVVLGSESLVAVDQTLKNISTFARLFEVLAKDARAIKIVSDAFLSLLSSAYGGIVLPGLVIFILLTILVIRHLRNPRRRSHNAPTCF